MRLSGRPVLFCALLCPSVFNCQRSFLRFEKLRSHSHFPFPVVSLASNLFFLVGLGRFELPTSPLSGVRSNQLSYRPLISRMVPLPRGRGSVGVARAGGAERNRTDDLLNANQALSQLSYSPPYTFPGTEDLPVPEPEFYIEANWMFRAS